ncbi:scavenger receptor class A member 3 [Patagioenas fasciata monilis]|uniref:Gypsy retrotransposon integrase-like protein 1 n=1 Tax=Patagioenas fasciata monilis TaxID=372326 RepID=A0A1V4J739_PATFA|nr:scavenger receptor class A member 3 [Patagioenas fasciata monilis]
MAYAWSRKNQQNWLVYNILRETLFGDPEEELGEFWQFRNPGKGRWPSRTLRLPFGKKQMWEEPGDGPPVHLTMLADARMEEPWKEEFAGVWARDETDCGRVAGEVEVNGTPVPFKPQPRLSAEMEEVAARMLWKLERGSVVVRGISPSNSPFKLSKKSDGKTWRLTLDCKAINRATPVVVPRVALERTKLVTTLSPQSKCFSVLDLSNAAFAIPLAAGSRARFAFTFRGQQYLFTRLPQGFHSTPSIVHRRVDEMLSQLDQEDRAWVLSFVDDILIAGRNKGETEARTRKVLKLIQKTGFKAKYEKAQLVRPDVVYLGMTIGPKGRGILPSRVDAIQKAPSPCDIHKLRSLLGQFANLQDHIPDYWELARPLQRLTLQDVPWEWGVEQEQALSRLKCTIQAAPTLRFPDKSQPFVIRLTINKETVAATLLQEDEGERLVPVGHHSRMLKQREVSCLEPEKGSLAAVWAVQAFKTLTGSAPICIQMPHSPWECLLWGEGSGSGATNLEPARWTLRLVNRGLTARGPQAERGLVPTAPPLQLLLAHVPPANVWFVATKEVSSMGFAAVSLEERWLLGVAEGCSALSAELLALRELMRCHRSPAPLYVYTSHWALVKSLRSRVRNWELWPSSGDGLWPSICQWVCAEAGRLHIRCVGGDRSEDAGGREWCRKAGRRAGAMAGGAAGTHWVWEPSKHEKQEIIAQCHGRWHEGVQGTLARVRRVACWQGDSQQVSLWVQGCLRCAVGRGAAGRVPPQRAEGPWSQLRLDCVSGLPEGTGALRALLVLEDEFSGWLEAFPLREKTAATVVEVLSREVWARYGTPGTVRLPRVPRFLRDAVLKVMPGHDMWPAWEVAEAGKPGPGAVVLQRLAQAAGAEWVGMLPLLLAAARATRVRVEETGPYQITCGFPVEMWWERERVADGNILALFRRLKKDGTGYRGQLEAALRGGLPRGGSWSH